MAHEDRPTISAGVFQKRFLRTSLLIAAIVWLELLVALVLALTGRGPAANLSSSDRLGFLVVSLGWPGFYGAILLMAFLIGLYIRGAAEFNSSVSAVRSSRLDTRPLNWLIVLAPGLIGALVGFVVIRRLL